MPQHVCPPPDPPHSSSFPRADSHHLALLWHLDSAADRRSSNIGTVMF